MREAQKPDHVSLNTLIGRLKEGRFVIPDFQRDFEWRPWDISELMRSIFRDYYIGSLLLWKGKDKNFDALSCEPIYGRSSVGSREFIVLDGQQRLTAMYYAFVAPDVPLPNRKNRAIYYICVDHFMEEMFDEAFQYDWHSKRISKLLGDTELQFSEHIFPLQTVGQDGWALPNWVQGYEKHWVEKAKKYGKEGDEDNAKVARQYAVNALLFGEHLKGITEQYQISYIELDKELELDKVCDIFTQINSRGIRLDVFDLINALLVPKGLQLKHMWRDAEPKLDFVQSEKLNVYVLQVMSLLRQAYCSPKYLYFLLPGQEKPIRRPDGTRETEVLIGDIDEFKERWNVAVSAMAHAIKLLRHPQEFGAIASRFFPYYSIIPVFSALQAYLSELPPEKRSDGQRKIRHWYWASVFINRYSGSVESTSARDFLDMKAWLSDDALEPSLIADFNRRFRSLELRREVRPSTSIYNGIFNLLVLAGARDWITGNVPQHDDLDDHHIVPASWGKANLQGRLVHTILNRSPLTSDTNRHVIKDQLPNVYLPQWIESSGEAKVRSILETHFISPNAFNILLRDPFTSEDFEQFISERQRTFQDAIEELLVKERLDLPANLRQLDADIEALELHLRKTLVDILGDDPAKVPSHIIQQVNDRIGRALKKNPAMDAESYEELTGKLQYFDLREIENVIVSKAVWEKFQELFQNKEPLIAKFGQLAELRNGIRHSRAVDEITRKEGEAAILWFNKILGSMS